MHASHAVHWPQVRRWGGRLFVVLVLGLLAALARDIDWHGAFEALGALPASTLWAAAALCALSHAIYASYDLFGRQQTGHPLSVPRTASVSFMSYAFNLNLGSLVGGIAFRYRLYTRLGLSVGTVTRVLLLSLMTNWLGYFAVAGVVLWLRPPELPPQWEHLTPLMNGIGTLLLAAVAAYLAACALGQRFDWRWHWRGQAMRLPPIRVALLQLVLASTSWMLIASIVWVLLQQRVPYPLVLGALLSAAVAGVITHVPAGLGVLEAVFAVLLADHVPQTELLGALIAYRALYYLLPLLVATTMFVLIDLRREWRRKYPRRP